MITPIVSRRPRGTRTRRDTRTTSRWRVAPGPRAHDTTGAPAAAGTPWDGSRTEKKRGPLAIASGPREKPRHRPTLPQSLPCSTIGPGGLYFRVRDGNGCYPSGIGARKKKTKRERRWPLGPRPTKSRMNRCAHSGIQQRSWTTIPRLAWLTPGGIVEEKKVVKPHDQLVLVSSTHCCASTSSLSTTWSTWGLQEAEASGTPNPEEGFPLRCFQRLSLPNIATRRCHWRDNRNTSGSSNPVLSY